MSTATDAMDRRLLAVDAQVGDLLVVAGRTRYDSTITAIETIPAGSIVRGPRGGRYALRRAQVVIRTRAGHNPVVDPADTVTVYRAAATEDVCPCAHCRDAGSCFGCDSGICP